MDERTSCQPFVGPSGLYTALILLDLGISFELIEARDRVGGRLFTHTFPDQTGSPYNYFDVGAMRFPKISSMRRVFSLFDYPPLNSEAYQLKKKLASFHYSNDNALLSYNGVTVKQGTKPNSEVFKAEDVIKDSGNATLYMSVGVKAIADDVIAPFVRKLLQDLRTGGHAGWDELMKFDHLSIRSYLCTFYRPSASLQARGLPDGPLSTDVITGARLSKSRLAGTIARSRRRFWGPSPLAGIRMPLATQLKRLSGSASSTSSFFEAF
jgi:phytoene dehydrogenase-like protein